MHLTFTGEVWNVLDNGALQTFKITRDPNRANVISQISGVKDSVMLFYDDTGRIIEKSIGEVQGLVWLIDWYEVNRRLEKYWKENKISSKEIEKSDIVTLLRKIGAVQENNDVVPAFIWKSKKVEEDPPMETIDITEQVKTKDKENA